MITELRKEGKEKVLKAFNQAKSSLKNFSTTEVTESVSKLLFDSKERKRLTNEKIVSSLKDLGMVTQSDLTELKDRITKLEAELTQKKEAKSS